MSTLRFAAVAAAMALAATITACTPAQDAGAAQNCDIEITAPVSFSHGEDSDAISARAIGPRCDRAIALFTIHSSEGDPIWAWASPMPRAFGSQFHEADDAMLREFLTQWAAPTPSTTASAPQWPEAAPDLPGGLSTTLQRAVYEDIRARDLPMLCHLTAVGRETCLYWEPAAALADAYFVRDAASADGPGG
jgi:hypothetical protein